MVALVGLPLLTSSAPAATDTIRFTAAGDYSASANAQAVFGQVHTINPDFHLALGDLSYGGTPTEQGWCDMVTSQVGGGFPFELLSGNHESNGQNGNINDFSACLPNEVPGVVGTYGRQYYFDYPRSAPIARFIFISPGLQYPDSTWTYAVGTPQYQWTAATIDAARAANIPWVIVGMHKPCLSVGEHGCEAGTDILNLLVSKKVDLVLTGHEHMYARTKQLALSAGCPSITNAAYNASCVTDSDATLAKGVGTVFDTVGTGGVETIAVDTTAPSLPYFAVTNGLNDNPTYGVLNVNVTVDTLTASFSRASGGTFADSFTIAPAGPPPPNQPPVAAFTSSTNALTASLDGSGSSDPDGTVASYAWTFGDGTSGTGSTTQHTYATAGTYQVQLTVTDNLGATNSITKSVTVTSVPTPVLLASDDFGRTLSTGWGTADTGGTWTVNGSQSLAAVSGGVGILRMATAGSGPSDFLATLASNDTELRATYALDKVPVGGTSGVDQGFLVRRVAGQGDYRAKVRVLPGGVTRLGLYWTNSAGAQTAVVAEANVAGLTYTAGMQLDLRVQATGTSPTTLRAKLWKHSDPEPASWMVSGTDNTAALQVAGSVGFHSYLAGTVTNVPLLAQFDNVRVYKASTVP